MNQLNLLFIILGFVLCGAAQTDQNPQTATAAVNFQPQFVGYHSSGSFLLGTELASFALPTGSLSGAGFSLGYQYQINPRLSLRGNLSQGFNTSQGFGFLYTNFGASVGYAIINDWSQDDTKIEWNGRPIVSIRNKKNAIWGLQGGFEQYLFGGTTTVYNAPGASMGIYSKFEMYNQEFLGTASIGSYKSNASNITGIVLKLMFLLK